MIGFIFLMYAIMTGWLVLAKKFEQEDDLSAEIEPVSLIIVYRNEKYNLERLIKGIESQSVDKAKLEIILVNDNSTDGGSILIQELTKYSSLAIRHVNLEGEFGKKAGISLGVQQASSGLVLCTDADCELPPNWVNTMIQPFGKKEVKMVLGAVRLSGSKSWFQTLQKVEFSTLMAITLVTCRRKRAILSNGANYSFRKAAFEESGAYANNLIVNTGDDVFFLHGLKKKFGKSCIVFSERESSVVTTPAKASYASFFEQRIRWASKSKNYKDIDTLKIGSIIFATNLSILWVFVGTLMKLYSLKFFIGCFLFKWVLDLLLVQQLPLFLRPKSIVKGTFILSILYPFYSVGIALLSLFYRPQWKGRKI
ncbi:glycosyltransferase [Vicingaceae bacterium]|nr:glycosyltransferase [Vicingaceae bacterium]